MSQAANSASTRRIVVGVDGSPSSKEALAWAAAQARLTGLRLDAVATWHPPLSYGWAPPWPEGFNLEAESRRALEETVTEVLGPDPDIEVTTEVVEGYPAHVLTEQSKRASLMVVGCRGHGEFAGMLLGSVSEFLTTHAHCPVVVIRDHEEPVRSG
jgi:nucleotide-binding universal stress UspA family protein